MVLVIATSSYFGSFCKLSTRENWFTALCSKFIRRSWLKSCMSKIYGFYWTIDEFLKDLLSEVLEILAPLDLDD